MSIRTVSPLVIAAELGRYARSRLDHLTDGRPLYIPGFDTEADPVEKLSRPVDRVFQATSVPAC